MNGYRETEQNTRPGQVPAPILFTGFLKSDWNIMHQPFLRSPRNTPARKQPGWYHQLRYRNYDGPIESSRAAGDCSRWVLLGPLTVRLLGAVVFLGIVGPIFVPAQAGVVASYSFDDPAALGRDSSGNQVDAQVHGAVAVPGRTGGAVRLDGTGGVEIPLPAAFPASGGMGISCWVRSAEGAENRGLIVQQGVFMLRLDPPNEGNQLSLFVNAGDQLEPRVRGRTLKPGVWHFVAASWDGSEAKLWIDGESYHVQRGGPLKPSRQPIRVGLPQKWAPTGWKGEIDEVRVYDHPLSEGEVLLESLDLRPIAGPVAESRTSYDFADGLQGWEIQGGSLAPANHSLTARTALPAAAIYRQGLAIPLDGLAYLGLRMAVSAGATARVVLVTDEATGTVALPIEADGRAHSYVVPLCQAGLAAGTVRMLCLIPSDQPAEVRLDTIRMTSQPDLPAELKIEKLLADAAINRAERPCRVIATVRNMAGPAKDWIARLDVPAGVTVEDNASRRIAQLGYGDAAELEWQVVSRTAGTVALTLHMASDAASGVSATVPLIFTPPLDLPATDYIPEPRPVTGDVLVGAHYCPLWKQGSRSSGWELITPYPERKPVLGWYDEDDPEVTDWEIKWALEHGISFFVYCWYRENQGRGVEMRLEHGIRDGLFRSRFGDRFKFCIMWENQNRGSAGVASEADFLENLLPFWIKDYFKHPSYLKIDNKPLLFIYRPEYLVGDLGGVANVRKTLDKVRQACREAGFDGLWILGEYRGDRAEPLELMRDEGLDHSFSYCWPVANHPSPADAIAAQEKAWARWQELDVLPYLLTVSMGWDSRPWHPSQSIWRLPPGDFQRLCEKARSAAGRLPASSLGRRLVLLDNWNEYGEGHYIAPHRQYGFGYLDAVRAAFTDASESHADIIPEDIGRGPYEKRFGDFLAMRRQCAERTLAPGGNEPGLIGWWTFDEEQGFPVARDYSGHGRGARVEEARRVPGRTGQALECRGGCVVVPAGVFEQTLPAVTVECWIRTETPAQNDKWFINSIYGDGAAGFRLGLHNGRLCWAVPQSPWSHHLVADRPLPLAEWAHVAGVCDGRGMSLYLNGEPCGTLQRTGLIRGSRHPLSLGSYASQHRAYFTGLLDEVRLYDRALTAAELRRRAAGDDGEVASRGRE